MLEQKDLCAIAELIDSRIGKTEDILSRRMEKVENNVKELNRNFQTQNRQTTLILEEYHKRLLLLEEKGA